VNKIIFELKRSWVIVTILLVVVPIIIGLISRELSYYDIRHYDDLVSQHIGVIKNIEELEKPFYKFYEPIKTKIELKDEREYILLSNKHLNDYRQNDKVIILTAKFINYEENGIPIPVSYGKVDNNE